MFVDQVKIYAQAGHGGPGCVAFQRESFRPKGGPSGGNGGRGGDVILEANRDINNLVAQFYQPRLIAESGKPGKGKGMDGHTGKDRIVQVPCGTVVWKVSGADGRGALSAPKDAEGSGEGRPIEDGLKAKLRKVGSQQALEIDLEQADEDVERSSPETPEAALLADLTEPGQRFLLCKGGRGGRGNRHFATATHQSPRFAQPGEDGDEGHYRLELRILAEVGLVGYPNAGKSTLLTAISDARPKIAPYPFTTLHPQIGVVDYPDYSRITVCDIPGIIEGAHQNVGLGHAFLRHIQRCLVLVLVIDMAGSDGRKPHEDYQQLLAELELYHPSLLEKDRFVVANKMDEEAARENLPDFQVRYPRIDLLPMAAAFDQGIQQFKSRIYTVTRK